MAKSLPREVKVGFRVAMASQPFHTFVVEVMCDRYELFELALKRQNSELCFKIQNPKTQLR